MRIKKKFKKLIFVFSVGAMLFPSAVGAHSVPDKSAVYESFDAAAVFSGLDIVTESSGNKAARLSNELTDIVYTPSKNMIIEGSFKVNKKGDNSLFEIIYSV